MDFSPTFLTVRQVAAFLKLSPLTIYEYIRRGTLRAAKFGRYYRVEENDLKEFINEHRFPNPTTI